VNTIRTIRYRRESYKQGCNRNQQDNPHQQEGYRTGTLLRGTHPLLLLLRELRFLVRSILLEFLMKAVVEILIVVSFSN